MAFSLTMPFPVRSALGEEQAQDVCARAAAGEREAILALYTDHHVAVRTFARRLIGDEALAEDLVHEVFLALPKALGVYRGECSIRSYLVSVAAGRARRLVRTAARRRAMEARFANEPIVTPAQPDHATERRELACLLSRALDELPVDQRVAFVLCEIEERSSVEVGAMLREKEGTIRARVFHAKKKLREALRLLAPDRSMPDSQRGSSAPESESA